MGVDMEVSEYGRGSGTEGGVSLSFFGGGRVPTDFSSSRGDMETSKGKEVRWEEGFFCFGFWVG